MSALNSNLIASVDLMTGCEKNSDKSSLSTRKAASIVFKKMIQCLLILISVTAIIACSSVGGTCNTNADCCTNLCSPTSCMQGQCIGSYCLTEGSRCQLDCQCCSGTCLTDERHPVPICGNPSKVIAPSNNISARPYCEGAYCGGGCDVGPSVACAVCCPVGTPATCDWSACLCYCGTFPPSQPSQFAVLQQGNVFGIILFAVIGLFLVGLTLMSIFTLISIRRFRRSGEQIPLVN